LHPFLFEQENLQSLGLALNKITRIPAIISKLKNLERLNISGNQLTDLCDEIATLPKLSFIDITSNKFTKLPTILSECSELKDLKWFKDNPLEKRYKDMLYFGEEKIKLALSEIHNNVPEIVNVTALIEITLKDLDSAIEDAHKKAQNQLDFDIANVVKIGNERRAKAQQEMQAAIQEAVKIDPSTIGTVVAKYSAMMTGGDDTKQIEEQFQKKNKAIGEASSKLSPLVKSLSVDRRPGDKKVEPIIEEVKVICNTLELSTFTDEFIAVFRKLEI